MMWEECRKLMQVLGVTGAVATGRVGLWLCKGHLVGAGAAGGGLAFVEGREWAGGNLESGKVRVEEMEVEAGVATQVREKLRFGRARNLLCDKDDM